MSEAKNYVIFDNSEQKYRYDFTANSYSDLLEIATEHIVNITNDPEIEQLCKNYDNLTDEEKHQCNLKIMELHNWSISTVKIYHVFYLCDIYRQNSSKEVYFIADSEDELLEAFRIFIQSDEYLKMLDEDDLEKVDLSRVEEITSYSFEYFLNCYQHFPYTLVETFIF